ncbi:hypothetical protein CERSUDRAFT_92082 [Gelatoporia subvermispora B]|uniref:Uncharacterized protein n=1 Tax=Ceriporiopsis subvermispora (strain B) TaxID=914234 RepID=M2PSE7_CERS8|nr:hypothetical protein CERSUDRAFT_92082 [Gelatoporia subvermispora B]
MDLAASPELWAVPVQYMSTFATAVQARGDSRTAMEAARPVVLVVLAPSVRQLSDMCLGSTQSHIQSESRPAVKFQQIVQRIVEEGRSDAVLQNKGERQVCFR